MPLVPHKSIEEFGKISINIIPTLNSGGVHK